MKPSAFSLLKFVYLTSQLRHPLAVRPLLRKILDPPLHLAKITSQVGYSEKRLLSTRIVLSRAFSEKTNA